MTSAEQLLALRDEVYLRLALRQIAGEFTATNNFTVEKTWRPWTTLEQLKAGTKPGKVYVIGMAPGDLDAQSRARMGPRDFCIQVGFQKSYEDINDAAEGDVYVKLVGELEDVCRCLVYPPDEQNDVAFLRIEFMRDPDGLPMSFTMMRTSFVFEAYFNVYFRVVVEGCTTTTTTTTTSTTTSTTTTT